MNITIILIVLLVGAIVTYISGNRFASKVALLFSVAAAVFSIALLIQYLQGGEIVYSIPWVNSPSISFSLKADGLSLAMLLMTTILVPVIIWISSAHPGKKEKILYSFILFMAFAIAGVFLSSNVLLYYIFWELSLIPIYFIILYWGEGDEKKKRKAAVTFFVYTFAGSMFMLAALIYLYQKVGSFELQALYNADLTPKEQLWVFLAFFFAYAIKTPIFPFHTWQADAYQVAPTAGTMLLACLMSKMGLYSILRWQIPIAPQAAKDLQVLTITLCVIGVIYGSILALRQDNIKRFLAFASLAHVGFIGAGLYALTLDGFQGAVLLIIGHAFAMLGMFLSADIIQRRTGTLSIRGLGGIRGLAPKFSMAFFLMILSSISVPISFNFTGEFIIMAGLYQVNVWYTVLVGTTMFLSAFIMLRMFQKVMLGDTDRLEFTDLTKIESTVYILISGVIIFFGLYSKPLADLILPSLQNITVYIN